METASLTVLSAVLAWIPWSLHHPLAFILGNSMAALPHRRARIAQNNLRIAFPDAPPAQIKQYYRASCRHTVRLVLEASRLTRTGEREVIDRMECNPALFDEFRRLAEEGRGFMLATAHFGNWEWLSAWLSLTLPVTYGAIYKPMHNPGADRWLLRLRHRFGGRVFATREKRPRELVEHLRRGGAAGILSDQDARRDGRFISFFGKPASTSLGLAATAIRLQTPILVGFGLRMAPGHFQLKLFPPLFPDPGAPDREAEAVRLMTQYNQYVEQMIRQAPEQYFWWHNRWKTQPGGTPDSALAVESTDTIR